MNCNLLTKINHILIGNLEQPLDSVVTACNNNKYLHYIINDVFSKLLADINIRIMSIIYLWETDQSLKNIVF